MKFIFEQCNSRKATLHVTIDAGSAVECGGKWTSGIAHIVEHMIFQGTESMTHEELTKTMGRYGVDWNGGTYHAKVAYYVTAPAENIYEVSRLLCEMLFNREFNKTTLDKEKLVVLEEKRGSEDDKESIIMEKFDKFICNGPIANSIIGTTKSIKSIKIEEIQEFYNQYYKSENMLVVLTGPLNINVKEIASLFGKNVESFKKSKRVKNLHNELKKKTHTGNVQQSTIYIAYKAIPVTHKDAFILAFMNKFFGEDMDSRLFQSLRQKYGLCYGAGGFPYLCDDIGWFVIWTKIGKENINKAVELIDKEIVRLVTEYPTEEEINRARNKYLSEVYSFLETSNGTNALISSRHYNNLPNIEVSLERAKNIDAAEILKTCKKYFKPENRKIFMYLPKMVKD